MGILQLEKERSKFHLIHGSVPDSTPRHYLANLDVYNKVLDNKKRGLIKLILLFFYMEICKKSPSLDLAYVVGFESYLAL